MIFCMLAIDRHWGTIFAEVTCSHTGYSILCFTCDITLAGFHGGGTTPHGGISMVYGASLTLHCMCMSMVSNFFLINACLMAA